MRASGDYLVFIRILTSAHCIANKALEVFGKADGRHGT